EAGKKVAADPKIVAQIKLNFGEEIFSGGILDNKKLASIVFSNPSHLKLLNNIIHPAVRKDFHKWLEKQKKFPIIIKEAAILFETGSYKECDAVITVTIPLDERIKRVILRDGLTSPQIEQRLKNQWTDEQRLKLSDYVIVNDTISNMQHQVREILKKLQNI
ncbi:MAG TPA: dephospho-CoA kinase, partial [Flavobacterium sp.]